MCNLKKRNIRRDDVRDDVLIVMRPGLFSLILFLFFSAFFISLLSGSSSASEHNKREWIESIISLEGEMSIIPLRKDSRIDELVVNTSHYPKETEYQKILSVDVYPKGTKKNGQYSFTYKNINDTDLSFLIVSRLKNIRYNPRIRKKIPFPLDMDSLDRETYKTIAPYLNQTKTIDKDDEQIVLAASSIAEGKDDLVDVVFSLAQWVNNEIDYSLSSLTADASQKASWVLSNKKGVCDELSTLFIAMNRALGIPSRYVSGLAYTDYELFDKGYDSHGWAEVWFPGTGWVPFDISYNQYGFIDASHIVFQRSADSSPKTTTYSWKGYAAGVKAKQLVFSGEATSFGPYPEDELDIKVNFLHSFVDIGSSNVLIAEVRNKKDWYQMVSLDYLPSQGVFLDSDDKKSFFLKPLEEKTVAWVIHADPSLDDGYEYTFTLGIRSNENSTVYKIFKARRGEVMMSLSDAKEYASRFDDPVYQGEEKASLSCNPLQNWSMTDSPAEIECIIMNKGTKEIKNVSICLDECKYFSVPIAQKRKASLSKKFRYPGKKDVLIQLKNSNIHTVSRASLEIFDVPELKFADASLPKEIKYNEKYQLSFNLKKLSYSSPENLTIVLLSEDNVREWNIHSLSADKRFVLNLFATTLNPGNNSLVLAAFFQDKAGNHYDIRQNLSLSLVNTTLMDELDISARKMFKNFEAYMPFLIVFIIISFLAIIFILLRSSKKRT